jgi:aspartate kinase
MTNSNTPAFAPALVVGPAVLSRRSHATPRAPRHVAGARRRNSPRMAAVQRGRPVAQPEHAPAPGSAPGAGEHAQADSCVALDRVVCKFGGSSLADASRLREVGRLVRLQKDASHRLPVVVLSAMGQSTNELLAAGDDALVRGVVDMTKVRTRAYNACDELGLDKELLIDPLLTNLDQLLLGVKFIKELSPRTLDYLVSFGERLSVRIFAAHLLQNEGLNAKHFDAYDMGFRTNSQFTNADLADSSFQSIKDFFDEHVGDDVLAVVTGFIAKDHDGNITTLGRGGSDLTASTIGASIGASEVQVWKDVDGILSTDPRIVPSAIPVPFVAFQEAAEMAFFGAKILHPIAMMPAMRSNIPVRVKNSYNPDHPGTVILAERTVRSRNPVTAISLKKNVQLVDICSTRMLGAYGFLAEVFKAFAQHKVSVDMIATSEVSISMTLNESETNASTRDDLVADLAGLATVRFSVGKAIVSLVSNVSKQSSEVVGRASMALHKAGIEIQMISQGASKFNISVIVEADQAKTAVRVLHKEFFGC